jgi:hypothetical protein
MGVIGDFSGVRNKFITGFIGTVGTVDCIIFFRRG